MNLVTAQAAIRYSVLIGICVACFLCCKYVSSKKNLRDEVKKRDLTFVERDKLKKNKTSTFVDMLAQHSSPVDKLIILAMTDYAFTDMAVNMYETSFKRHGITNFLFVGAGQKSCEILITKYSLPCFHYANDSSENVASVFQSPEFNRKMNIRTYMIIEALQAGYTVLHTDTDVVFLQNPLPELKDILRKSDIAALWDDSAYNAGFIAIKPTEFSIRVYKRMKSITDSSAQTPDQEALNVVLGGKSVHPSQSSVIALDRNRYLCGLAYYEHGNRYFPSDCPECIVVHNNWIVGREAKIYRFKEHLTWMIDDDSYYRSSKRKYISYHNPMKWSSQQETENEELDALKSALAIGKLLDRIVILPRFHCDGKECPLNSLISVAAFDNQFSGKYRENSFPRHPWIPPSLKKPANVSHMIITPNNSHFSKNLTKQVNGRVLDTTGSGIVNESQLRANFDDFNDSILQFVHLYRVPVVFENDKLQCDFRKLIKEAFQRKGYRQF